VKLIACLDDLARRNLQRPHWCGRLRAAIVAGMALSLSAQVAWSAQCKPHHFRTPYFIKSMMPVKQFSPDEEPPRGLQRFILRLRDNYITPFWIEVAGVTPQRPSGSIPRPVQA
jgi:hypothetical protein